MVARPECGLGDRGDNNFIMTTVEGGQVQQLEKKNPGGALLKGDNDKAQQMVDYDPTNSEFMRPLAEPKHAHNESLSNKIIPKVNKSVVLTPQEVEKSLREIYHFYAKSYQRPSKQSPASFSDFSSQKIIMQAYFLFCKNFHILKAIFTVERLTIIFKKHADYGKYLTFDNFYFMINSMSHQPEAKQFFHLEQMVKNLDIETAQQLERQEFYNYLQLGSPERYRECFSELFMPFNMHDKPTNQKKQYNYRKFSLPELRKKAIPQPRQRKKGQKDFFILKHDKQVEHNQFDEAKSIVVSWDSLRAKSVNNLGKSSELVERKYLRADPQLDPYLQQVRPSSRQSPKGYVQSKLSRLINGGQIEKKIREIEKSENLKNKQILQRIQKKLNVKSGRKLQI